MIVRLLFTILITALGIGWVLFQAGHPQL